MTKNPLHKLLVNISDQSCMSCGSGESVLCQMCEVSEIRPLPPTCMICNSYEPNYRLCLSGCRSGWGLDAIFGLSLYDGVMKELLMMVKARSSQHVVPYLAKLLWSVQSPHILAAEFDLLAPAPSSQKARRQRGFDFSENLAMELSQLSKIPVFGGLRRIGSQSQKSRNQRQRLAQRKRTMYQVDARKLSKRSHRNILIVDDIMTTGSTLSSASHSLKKAGANKCSAVVVARSPWQ